MTTTSLEDTFTLANFNVQKTGGKVHLGHIFDSLIKKAQGLWDTGLRAGMVNLACQYVRVLNMSFAAK